MINLSDVQANRTPALTVRTPLVVEDRVAVSFIHLILFGQYHSTLPLDHPFIEAKESLSRSITISIQQISMILFSIVADSFYPPWPQKTSFLSYSGC